MALLTLGATLGCGGASGGSGAPSADVVRSYNGTASLGDFTTLALDASTGRVAYADHGNAVASGGVPFTGTGGAMTVSDPTGGLTALEERPGTACLGLLAMAGPARNAQALVTALPSSAISPASLANLSANFIQFRTSGGGIAAGTLAGDAGGSLESTGFQPYANLLGSAVQFLPGGITGNRFSAGADGTYLDIAGDLGAPAAYAFGNPAAWLALDSAEGSTLAMPKAASAAFPAASAGAYAALVYRKTGANMAAGSATETGAVTTGAATVTIAVSPTNTLTVQDGSGQALLGPILLLPVSAMGLGTGLNDPCYGLFGNQITTLSPDVTTQWVFAAFPPEGVVFAWFNGHGGPGAGSAATYDYLYGVGLKP